MKETKELNRLAGKLVNAGYDIAEDGQINFADLPKLFDPLMAGQAGVDGIGMTATELATATPAQKAEAVDAFADELKSASIDESDAGDITQIFAGIQAVRAMVARKTRKETADQIAAALRNGPQAASGEPLTGDDLLALIED